MQLQKIETKIYEVRGEKVMLDVDLAEMYEVQTKSLNLAVKRNLKRFPFDFMFQLTKVEWDSLRSQISTSNALRSQIVTLENSDSLRLQNETSKGRGGTRYLPYAFTEQGLAMLSGILNSDKAIEVNIAIMRAFVLIRQFALSNTLSHKELTDKLQELETTYNKQFKDVYEAINYLLDKDKQDTTQKERKPIGYK